MTEILLRGYGEWAAVDTSEFQQASMLVPQFQFLDCIGSDMCSAH